MAGQRGLVLEVQGRQAVVLTREGEFRRILLPAGVPASVGDEVELPEGLVSGLVSGGRPRRNWWAVLVASLILALLLPVAGPSPWMPAPVYAYVSVDINPSVQFGTDRQARVLTAHALDADGERLLAGLRYYRRPLVEVFEDLARAAAQQGFLSGGAGTGVPPAGGAAGLQDAGAAAPSLILVAAVPARDGEALPPAVRAAVEAVQGLQPWELNAASATLSGPAAAGQPGAEGEPGETGQSGVSGEPAAGGPASEPGRAPRRGQPGQLGQEPGASARPLQVRVETLLAEHGDVSRQAGRLGLSVGQFLLLVEARRQGLDLDSQEVADGGVVRALRERGLAPGEFIRRAAQDRDLPALARDVAEALVQQQERLEQLGRRLQRRGHDAEAGRDADTGRDVDRDGDASRGRGRDAARDSESDRDAGVDRGRAQPGSEAGGPGDQGRMRGGRGDDDRGDGSGRGERSVENAGEPDLSRRPGSRDEPSSGGRVTPRDRAGPSLLDEVPAVSPWQWLSPRSRAPGNEGPFTSGRGSGRRSGVDRGAGSADGPGGPPGEGHRPPVSVPGGQLTSQRDGARGTSGEERLHEGRRGRGGAGNRSEPGRSGFPSSRGSGRPGGLAGEHVEREPGRSLLDQLPGGG